MLRSLASRLLALALTASTTVLGSALVAPADAATGDVMTLEWHTQTSSSRELTTSADVTTYDSSSTTAPSGARFATPVAVAKSVTLAPPAGVRFQAGQTYAAAYTATGTLALLKPSYNVFSTSLCGPNSTGRTFEGTVTVLAAAYDDAGALTELAADYEAACTLTSGSRSTEYIAGAVRHNSSVGWLSQKSTYTPDTVPTGRQRTQPVSISATSSAGKSLTLGAATLAGVRAADYRVVSNGCAGRTLAGGDSCTLEVAFEPVTASAPAQRVAMLTLASPGHVSSVIRVRLASTAIELPGPPDRLTTFPTADGVGVTWRNGSPSSQQYVLERSHTEDGPWTPLATMAYAGNFYSYVDRDTQPGQQVHYRVTGTNDGWAGPAATTSTTRPLTTPTATPDSLVAYGSTSTADPDAVIRDGVDGETVSVEGGYSPVITASGGPNEWGSSWHRVTFYMPVVPGPGTYASPHGGGMTFGGSPYNCSYAESVLEVRSVVYDETPKPLVLDGSWVGRCTSGVTVRVEIRLGVGTSPARLTSEPAKVGRLTTWGGRTASATVTVANAGPSHVTLGSATTTGTAATDWRVTDNGCAGTTLQPQDTCPVTVTFSSTAGDDRSAVLRVAASDGAGRMAPLMVPLDGWGATVPGMPVGWARGTIGAVLGRWSAPSSDGGLPVLSYDVHRRLTDTTTWRSVTTVPAGSDLSFVDRTVGTHGYDYRVRAVNEVGGGPWRPIGLSGTNAGNRAVVVSGSTSLTGPRGLFQVDEARGDAPFIALTDDSAHDHRTPAVSSNGARLAVSISTGDGSDGEYDLWSGTLAEPATRRLTSMTGAETEPSYSPDNTRIAFTHVAADGSRSVWVVPALGGEAREVRVGAGDPAWMPDNRHLIVEDRSGPDRPLLSVDVTTGTATPVPHTEAGSQPTVSRAGALAYVDAGGRVLEIPAGQTMPVVKVTPAYNGVRGRPAYDAWGEVYSEFTRTSGSGAPVTAGGLNALLAREGEPAPVQADLTKPWLTARGLVEMVRGTVSFDVSAYDEDTPQSMLRPTCRLDRGAWWPCAGPQSLTNLSEGWHVLAARVTDQAGHTAAWEHKFVSDTLAPRVTMTGPGRWQDVRHGRPTFTWFPHDAGSGLSRYQAQQRTATPSKGYTAYRAPRGYSGNDSRRSVAPWLQPGQEYCFRVRVQDLSGLWSPYVVRCTVRPVDDKPLRASRGWRRTVGSDLYNLTGTTTSRKGATLRTAGVVTTRRIGVVATTCPRCGAVAVYIGSKYVGKVSLVSPRRRYIQLRQLPLLPRAVSGRVVLKTLSSRPVTIDGLSMGRS